MFSWYPVFVEMNLNLFFEVLVRGLRDEYFRNKWANFSPIYRFSLKFGSFHSILYVADKKTAHKHINYIQSTYQN